MSRVGQQPIEVPAGVDVSISGLEIKVKGPKGELVYSFHPDMTVKQEDGTILVQRPTDRKDHKSLHGLTRSLIANMVEGVTNGYEKRLKLVGTGYRASKTGENVTLAVGYSHPVEMEPPEGIEIDVPDATTIVVQGVDKQMVGQFAAEIRAVRRPEPFLGKGIRYIDERVRRKPGKAGKVTG